MAADDDVQLTDLEVIQQFSLAVRGVSAPRDVVIAALQSDLDYLIGPRRRTAAPAPATVPARTPAVRTGRAAPGRDRKQ